MIRAQRALLAGAAVAGFLAACSNINMDPCAGAATCVSLDVDSLFVESIDQLELDVVYADLHATTTIGMAGTPVSLPLAIPLTLDLPKSPLIQIELVAAAKLRGALLGAGAASTTVQQGYHGALRIFVEPVDPCTEGAVYCGGTIGILRDGQTLYRCTGGVPIFYARCSSGCSPHFEAQGECFGGGLCRDGGAYCGGHVLDGDPSTLYVCMRFEGTTPTQCPNGCLVRGDGDDACK
jgi:hypothetical protein